MKPLAIYYSPGCRGDFLSNIIQDKIELPSAFKSVNQSYRRIHEYSKFVGLGKFYTIRITTNTAIGLIESTLLHIEKNNTKFTNLYDSLYIIAKQYYLENNLSKALSYSASIDFLDLYNITKIADLYYDYSNRPLTDKHIEFAEHNNQINREYLNHRFLDNKIVRSADLLQFEIEHNLLNQVRKFSFDEYLLDSNYNRFLKTDYYI
jgi:hypothetical protein